MNVIESFGLQGTGPFKNTKFKIKPGVSAVYGLNKTNAKNSRNGNAAGKSFLFSQLNEIFYDNPIVGEKQDRVKEGKRFVTFHSQDRKIQVVKQGNKIKGKVDGKLKKFRTIALAKEWLAEAYPLTEEEFGTYVYLDSRVPHPLVMGNSTQRRQFFTSFFGLDKIDTERQLFQAELSKLSKIRASYKELKAEYDNSKTDLLHKSEIEEITGKVSDLEEQLEKKNKLSSKLQEAKRVIQFYDNAKQQIKALKQIVDNLDYGDVQNKIKDIERDLEENEDKLEQARQYERFIADSAEYEEAIAKLKPSELSLLEKYGDRVLEVCAKSNQVYASSFAKYEELKQERAQYKHELKKLNLDKVDKPDFSEGEVRVNLTAIRHQLEHAEKFDKGVCSTCGQEVTVKDRSKLQKIEKRLEAQLEKIEEYQEYKEAKKKAADYKDKIASIDEELAELNEVLEKNEKKSKAYFKIKELPNKPKKFKGLKLESKVMKRMVDEDREKLQLLEFCMPHMETISAYFELPKKIKQKAADSSLDEEIQEINNELSRLKGTIEAQRVIHQRAKRIKERLLEMKEQLKDEPDLKFLVDAYSKSLKKLAIKSIANRLMATVNKYAKVVFPEDYSFSFQWESSQLSLIVHRRYGKKIKASDVRKLSGAESKLFTVVLVLALMTFVPHHKRSNVLILDEPTATFSKETTEAFKELLPVVNQVIPSIIIITPKSEDRFENALNYTVIKEKGQSTIVEGHPDDL